MLQIADMFMVTPQFFAVSPYSYGGASLTPRVAYGYIPTANMNMQYYYVNPTCQQWNNTALAPQTYAKNPYAIGDSIIKGIVETSLTRNDTKSGKEKDTKSTEEEDVFFFPPYIDCYAKTERTEKQYERLLRDYDPWKHGCKTSIACDERGYITMHVEKRSKLNNEHRDLIKTLVSKQASLFDKGFTRFDGPMYTINRVSVTPLAQEIHEKNSEEWAYTKLYWHQMGPLSGLCKDLYNNPIKPLSDLTEEQREDILKKRYVIKYDGELMGKDTESYETWEQQEKNLAILRGRIMKRNNLFRKIPVEKRSQEWETFVSKKWDMIMSEAVSLFCPRELVKLILNCFGSDDRILPGYGFCVEEEVDMQDSPYDKETLKDIKKKIVVDKDNTFVSQLWQYYFNLHFSNILFNFSDTAESFGAGKH